MLQTSWKERNRIQAQFDFASGKLVITGDSFPLQAQQKLVAAYPITTTGRPACRASFTTPTRTILLRASASPGGRRRQQNGGSGRLRLYYNFLPVFIGFRQLGFNNPPFLLAETYEADPA